ncbi:MAG: leucine-rich repeat domain-containing protein, partial [Bacteroidetes bacterium]|nr:leucine-rich repeat domain-containing protein [Bacteroidota bacterium]
MKRIPSVFFFFIALTIGLFGSAKAQAQVNMSRFIKLTVAKDSVIKLDFKAATDNTPVKVKSGSLDTTFMVGTALHPKAIGFTAGDSTMTVYGDLTAFFCRKNQDNITTLDVSNNTELTTLSCYNNAISSLDVSKLTKLTDLYCFANSIDSLDLKKNEQLKFLDCSDNKLTALDLSKNTILEKINCSNNEITSLDVSKMTELNELRCHVNKIESLDVSNNAKLRILYCAQNKISTLNVR